MAVKFPDDRTHRVDPDEAMHEPSHARPFPNVVRLFPLQDVTLFPHTVLPLHIFEPRYRQMTEDALAGDRLIAMVRVRPGALESAKAPPVEEVAGLGEIVRHQRLPDGRFHLLLAGRSRVRLRHEIASDKLYRIAAVDVLEDERSEEADEAYRSDLLALTHAFLAERQGADADLGWLLKSDLPLGALTDIIASALGLPADVRQTLLNECRVERRLSVLLEVLRRQRPANDQDPAGVRRFPPGFSDN